MKLKSQEELMCGWPAKWTAPTVVVRCTVFNHGKFIERCLQGFLMQETDFPFEVFVHDDASTDRSADIIRRYAERYPLIIKAVYENENQYSKHDGSFFRTTWQPVIQGGHKYVALCEGDDYWTDPKKLQKQVEYMESHLGCVMTFHHRWVAGADGMVLPANQVPEQAWTGVAEWPKVSRGYLLTHADMVPPTLTMMMKRSVMESFPPWGWTLVLGDRTWAVWVTGQGGVEFVSGIGPSVYRRHDGGVSSRTGIVAQAIRQCESDMAFYENLEIDAKTRRIMVREMSSRAARVKIARLGAPPELLTLFFREAADFGQKHPEFQRAYRRAFLLRAWSNESFRLLALHRMWHRFVECLKKTMPNAGYRWLRRKWRILRQLVK
jgi:glycosyltransferase involved in cell wall biosynthesis